MWRGKFGNVWSGSGKNANMSGASDAFSVTLSSPGEHEVQASLATQNAMICNSTISGCFWLKFGNSETLELPYDTSTSAMQVALTPMYNPQVSVEVNHKYDAGKSIWSVTFLSHLKEWSENPLTTFPDLDKSKIVSILMEI